MEREACRGSDEACEDALLDSTRYAAWWVSICVVSGCLMPELLYGTEREVDGDSAYAPQQALISSEALQA